MEYVMLDEFWIRIELDKDSCFLFKQGYLEHVLHVNGNKVNVLNQMFSPNTGLALWANTNYTLYTDISRPYYYLCYSNINTK